MVPSSADSAGFLPGWVACIQGIPATVLLLLIQAQAYLGWNPLFTSILHHLLRNGTAKSYRIMGEGFRQIAPYRPKGNYL